MRPSAKTYILEVLKDRVSESRKELDEAILNSSYESVMSDQQIRTSLSRYADAIRAYKEFEDDYLSPPLGCEDVEEVAQFI